uniref:Ig-like domain-containing protein n=1 Tax=Pyxicephalus adspersus TaxID=30357 RepID=A0AAV3A7H1_PYXAD|nr:TPA: hypothetical protein GDO54_013573 [Pyxicephalus adspersus]
MAAASSAARVQSAEQLTQSDPVVIEPGNSHTLTCKGSGFTFSGYWMSWFKEYRGKLQWIADIRNDGTSTYYHDDVKGRFTITRDNNNNILSLKMENTKTEDCGLYYCTRYTVIKTYFGLNKNYACHL